MLDELSTLALVAETGSLQAAANRRGLTQPAVTRQIQRLEDELGVLLLDRNVKPARLTRAGEAVLERGRTILESVGDLRRSVAADAEASGSLRVGIAHGLSEPGIVEIISRFKSRMTAVFPSLRSGLSSDLVSEVRAGRLDVAIILHDATNPMPDGLGVRLLGVERVVPVAARAAKARPSHEPPGWVINPEGCLFRSKLERWHDAHEGTPLPVATEAQDSGLQAALIASGLGRGLMRERILANHPLRHLLIPIDAPGLEIDVQVVSIRAGNLGPLDRAVDVLEEELARMLAG